MPPPKTAERTPGGLADLETALGLSFTDRNLLAEALTHRSYVHEHADDDRPTNERLEFLGDAIFQLYVADALYHRFPDAPEGELTALRAAVVSTESFAAVGEALDLAPHLRVSRGEAALDGRGRSSILAGAVEAVVAAVYLDAGPRAARELVGRLVEPRLQAALNADEPLNVKGRLQEVVQAERGVTPKYEVIDRSGPVHAQRFVVKVVAGDDVLGEGSGVGKREAEQRAARIALEKLDPAAFDAPARARSGE